MQAMKRPRPAFYIFMCSVERPPNFPKPSCVNDNTRDLFNYLASKVMQKGIINTVVPVQTGCLNRCSFGPVMVVEPGNYMYVRLDKEKIDRIIDEHIIEGNPVEEYLIDKDAWSEPITPKEAMKMAGVN